jgi:hypothetical protein
MASKPDRCEASVGLIVADDRGRYFALAWADLERFRVPEALAAALAAIAEGGEPGANEEDMSGFGNTALASGPGGFLEEALRGWGSRRARVAVRRLPAWELLRA